MLNHFCLSFFM
jgi:hypothetical protein